MESKEEKRGILMNHVPLWSALLFSGLLGLGVALIEFLSR
jgi:hypothetical protein